MSGAEKGLAMKDKGKTNIATAMAHARTASEMADVVAIISSDLEACRRNRAEMQERRRYVVLEGGDLGELSRDLAIEEERITALEEALSECQLRLTEAVAAERKSALTARSKKANENDLPALRDAWAAFHEAMVQAIVAGGQVLDLSKAIDEMSAAVIADGRPELAIMSLPIRGEVEKELVDADRSRGESPVTFFRAGQAMAFLVEELTGQHGSASGDNVGRLLRFNRALAIQEAAGKSEDLKVA
jgi:hypothetical protein